MRCKLYKHYDEAGLAQINAYDFKGNPLSKTRQVIKDEELIGNEKYVVDWTGLSDSLLDGRAYNTQLFYDGLHRVRLSILPEEVSDGPIAELPKELVPTYNRAGALQSIAFAGTEHVRHIAYNAKGQRVLMAMGNSMMTRYAYDPVTFRLQRIKTERYVESSGTYTPQSGSTKQDTAYEYDLGGNIIKIKERVSECGIVGTALGAHALDKLFTYDPLKRLLTATGRESSTTSANHLWDDTPVNSDLSATRAYTQHFTYDKLGNILLLDHDATGNNYNRYYRYTNGKNLLEQIDNDGSPADVYSTFAYDANGNLISSNTDRYYEWDAADQLRYFKIFDGSTITKQAQYLYAGGQRVKKVVRTGTALEITVYIDGVYEHRYKANVGSTTLTPQHQNNYFVMDGRSRIATVRLGHAWGDTAPDLCYNLEDHLGTSTTRLNEDGTGVDREEYYPFGDSCLRTIDKKRYRYVGKEKDNESGLYYYGARYYAAWTCRFVSVDPLAGEYPYLTPYNYAGNEPIGHLDIDGMQSDGNEPVDSGGSWYQNPIDKKALFLPSTNKVVTHNDVTMLRMDGISPKGEFTQGKYLTPDTAAGWRGSGGGAVLSKMYTASTGKYNSQSNIDQVGVYDPCATLCDFGGELYNDAGSGYEGLYFPSANNSDFMSVMTHNQGIFHVNSDFQPEDFFSLVVGSWTRGVGYENMFFDENSPVGYDLIGTKVFERALWRANNSTNNCGEPMDLPWTSVGNGPGNPAHLYNEWLVDGVWSDRDTYKTVSHTLGGALWSFKMQGDSALISVFNVTNVPSATGGNAAISNFMGGPGGYPRPKTGSPQPFTNASQMIQFRVPVSSLMGR